MDPPHLLPLGFLLLALAAPHPNIAMSTVGTAEWTEGYSTEVILYLCKDCNSCTCKSEENYTEEFKKNAGTQSKIHSDIITELVTNKTHTTVCFEEPNFCLEGPYMLYWRKPKGSGLSCGILSSGGNGRGGISSEKTICCEAETGNKKYNPDLKCFYNQRLHQKVSASPAGITGERTQGNPEVPPSKANSPGMWIGILFAVLIVGVGTGGGTMYYCLRLRRRGQAHSQDTQAEGEDIPLNNGLSTREDPSLPAASSSPSLRMRSNI